MRPGRFGRYAIRTADGVQEAAYLPIGGIEQYIRVRGRSRANPVLLVLHGGPGSTLGATACRWQGALEAAFTVVHWDQRGSGNTYYRDPAAPPPTVERLLSDLDELVDALRARYGRDRLFLLGHSWGSLLGGLYALRRPEKLSAWLPVSQMVDFKRSEQVSAAEAIRRAREAGREKEAERLAQELEQVLALRRLDRAGAEALLRFRRRKERYLPPQYGGPSPLGGLAAPELTGNDLRWKLRFDRMLAANAALYEELLGGPVPGRLSAALWGAGHPDGGRTGLDHALSIGGGLLRYPVGPLQGISLPAERGAPALPGAAGGVEPYSAGRAGANLTDPRPLGGRGSAVSGSGRPAWR